MRHYITNTICLIALSAVCHSQKIIDVENSHGLPQNAFFSVGGEPFVNAKFVRLISGTPYFKTEWLKGTGVSGNGNVYKAGILKLDLYDNQVHFLDGEGKEMIATSDLKQLELVDTITNDNWSFIHSSLFPAALNVKQGWYLQLAMGNVGLFQFFNKTLSESTPYGSATSEQRITTKEEFFVYHQNALKQVKKTKDLIAVLNDKQSELETHLKNNSKGKTLAEQLATMVEFYNQ